MNPTWKLGALAAPARRGRTTRKGLSRVPGRGSPGRRLCTPRGGKCSQTDGQAVGCAALVNGPRPGEASTLPAVSSLRTLPDCARRTRPVRPPLRSGWDSPLLQAQRTKPSPGLGVHCVSTAAPRVRPPVLSETVLPLLTVFPPNSESMEFIDATYFFGYFALRKNYQSWLV